MPPDSPRDFEIRLPVTVPSSLPQRMLRAYLDTQPTEEGTLMPFYRDHQVKLLAEFLIMRVRLRGKPNVLRLVAYDPGAEECLLLAQERFQMVFQNDGSLNGEFFRMDVQDVLLPKETISEIKAMHDEFAEQCTREEEREKEQDKKGMIYSGITLAVILALSLLFKHLESHKDIAAVSKPKDAIKKLDDQQPLEMRQK